MDELEANDAARAQARRELIRELLLRGDRVVLRMHPHYHDGGYAVFVDHVERPVYVCELATKSLPEGIVDTDIVTMDMTAPDPERSVMEWLSREFPGISLENVQIERYQDALVLAADADDDMSVAERDALQVNLRYLNLSSCDFVGDSGCTDPDCWRCHSPMGPANLRQLAKNLATAAMLCRAWQLRNDQPAWKPGCNLPTKETKEIEVSS